MKTYKKAIERKIPLVSTLWIEACKAELAQVSEADYEPNGLEKFKDELPLYNFKLKVSLSYWYSVSLESTLCWVAEELVEK